MLEPGRIAKPYVGRESARFLQTVSMQPLDVPRPFKANLRYQLCRGFRDTHRTLGLDYMRLAM